MKAGLPENEIKRLKELESLEIMNTMFEQEYDNLVLIASQIAQTPISLISLVNEDKQWFKAKVGLEVRETSRDAAFCAHAILNPNEPMVISDTLEDHRFQNNPLVTSDPKIRFYAGIPLVTSKDLAVGTLCVIDREPRKLTHNQYKALKIIASQVIELLQVRKQNILINRKISNLKSIDNYRSLVFETASDELNLSAMEIKFLIEDIKNLIHDKKYDLVNEILSTIDKKCNVLLGNINQVKSIDLV